MKEPFSSYTFGEANTGGGQLIQFTCRPGEVQKVADFLGTEVRNIDVPTTKRMSINHGGYGRYTRYEIIQHLYGGGNNEEGGGGYREVLEIKNPPEGHWGIVTHDYTTWEGSSFIEWNSVEDATKNFNQGRWNINVVRNSPKPEGFKRFVKYVVR